MKNDPYISPTTHSSSFILHSQQPSSTPTNTPQTPPPTQSPSNPIPLQPNPPPTLHTSAPHAPPIYQDTDNILIKLHHLYHNILKQY